MSKLTMKTVWLPGSLEASKGTLGGSCRQALRTAVSEDPSEDWQDGSVC